MPGNIYFIVAIAAALPLSLFVESQTITPAKPCINVTCNLPNCFCSGPTPPKNMSTSTIPQLVLLTFDDAVNIDNFPFYEDVFKGRTNPNGAPITATFFVAHEYTNYSMVNQLYVQGHEIALHSISHNTNSEYWRNLSAAMWTQEVIQQRDQMINFARIPASEITGFRAPHLQIGGDTMYDTLKKGNIKWECSRPTLNNRDPGMWPYTNDFLSNQDCQIEPCPVGAYPGFWTVPMVDMLGDDNEGCAMADTCKPVPETKAATFELLTRNFNTTYYGNRSPFGVYVHHAWMNGTECQDCETIWERRRGYEQFLDWLGDKNDVYIVSISRAIKWMETAPPLAEVDKFQPFLNPSRTSTCTRSYPCRYTPDRTPPAINADRYMDTCIPCPAYYPYVGNPLGRNPWNKKLRSPVPLSD